MPNPRILVVEDNPDIVANLFGYLEPLGYTLDVAHNGYAGLARAAERAHDVIVLDLTLPGLDGLDVCRRVREELRCNTPILMLTARDTVEDTVVGLRSGADDYLVKPFSLAELEARLQALVRRSRNEDLDPVLRVGTLVLDRSTRHVTRGGKQVTLSPVGFRVLEILMRASPRVVTKDAIEQEIWGEERPMSDALRTHIHAVRQAVDKPFSHPMLLTIAGIGYRLVDADAS